MINKTWNKKKNTEGIQMIILMKKKKKMINFQLINDYYSQVS